MSAAIPLPLTLAGTHLHIDLNSAIEAFSSYTRDMEFLRAGGSPAMLGYDERRATAMPQIIEVARDGSFAFRQNRQRENDSSELFGHKASNAFQPTERNRIVYMELSGVMTAEGGPCNYGVAAFSHWLTSYASRPDSMGVLLRVRSGGGEAMAADILRSAIQASPVPVLVYTDLMGSAALYGTIDADEIIASSHRARIGSIGSMVSLDRKFIEQYKERILDIYSDLSPDKNKEWRALLADDLGPLKEMVRNDASEFREDVRKHRRLKGSPEEIEQTLSGGMFPAEEAKKRGLIDGIGTLNYAVRRVRAHAQL